MAAPTIFRSSDVGAPVLNAGVGTIIDVLDACLVNGYGGVAATVTITSDGTTVSDGDTITIDGTTYTWKTGLTPSVGQVLIGANAAANLSNLAAAIMGWGVAGTNYATGTTQQANLIVTALTATTITLQARKAGTAGNALAISKSAVHISLSGATLSGGTAGSTQTALGWTKSFSGTFGAVYRQPAGKQFYLWINDNAPGAGLTKECRVIGAEVYATAYSGTIFTNATNPFPTAAQRSTGMFGRKSSTLDQTARPWTLIGDDRTFYLFMQSGDTAGAYTQIAFGDFYSLLPADAYNCMCGARLTENSGTNSDVLVNSVSTSFNTGANTFVARAYTGTGGSQAAQTQGDTPCISALNYPNPVDGCVYLGRLYLSPSIAGTSTAQRHGWFRGFEQLMHAASNVIDGDTLSSASGEFSGKSFLILKANQGGAAMVVETTAWDTSV